LALTRRKPKGPRIDYSAIAAAGGIAKGPSIQLEKGWKKKQFEQDMADAYVVVDLRDGNRSRISGKALLPMSSDPKQQREHNHLVPRSLAKSLRTAVKNIFLVSQYEHGFITRNELLVHGKDANKPLKFSWNRNLVPPGKEPFRIWPYAR
jgi:hypothetical protein